MNGIRLLLHSLTPWGTGAIQWVQTWRAPWLDVIFVAASLDSRGAAFAIAFPLIYWCVDCALGIELLYLNVMAQFVTASIKLLLAIPRPDLHAISPLAVMPDSYSFPSGHAQLAVTLFGYLAIRTRNPWFRALCIAFVPLIAVSRVYLGVHYPQDVIGGIIVGLVCLLVFRWFYPLVHGWAAKQHSLSPLVTCALGAAVPLLIGFATQGDDASMEPALRASGMLAGLSVGLIIRNGANGLPMRGPWPYRALQFVVGMLLLGALYGTVHVLDTWLAGPTVVHFCMTWVQFGALGWGLVCGVPWLLTYLGLFAAMSQEH